MSGQPFGDQKSNPYQTPQFGASAGDSPELLSRANSAFNLAIGGLFVAICCCGVIGLIMGVMAMNNASGVVAVASPGSEAASKAGTAKTLGIVAIAIGGIKLLFEIGGGAIQMLGQ
ncbi:MAG: hypothetical protein IAF94_12705 [Pirellulaceae bacterium]|nr:hypothetical protein [Pirellulaceae bacterium]